MPPDYVSQIQASHKGMPENQPRKAPAYLLVTHDPYFSIWSCSDNINETPTVHWSGRSHALSGLIKVDGINYLFLGALSQGIDPGEVHIAKQINVSITAMQTKYTLVCGKVEIHLGFLSPLLMDDLDILSRPVTYISVKAISLDKNEHEIQVYFGASSYIAGNEENQFIKAEVSSSSTLSFLKAGTTEQPVLDKKGDDVRIDWGYLYVASSKNSKAIQSVTSPFEETDPFSIRINETGPYEGPGLLLNTVFPREQLKTEKEFLILLAYDDIYSINYFGTSLRPWWNRKGNTTILEQLELASRDYEIILKKCDVFETDLHETARIYGGETYARLLDLSYRQCIAAHKLVESEEGEILFLSKENFSNGSVNTVDVTYPSAPLFLIYNTDLLKGMLNGIFYYSESGKWTKPFPAHDLGTYPIATGQTYHEDMPVEEAGNMLILTAAIARADGNADYAAIHWESLTIWVNYLCQQGFDPESQLCTDDFAGHLARNANLSVKAIVAIGSYAYLAEELDYKETAAEYIQIARSMAEMWKILADAGDHYALTFNDKNTWSQKYNLVWDKLLELDIFSKEIYEKEIEFYLKNINEYGLPLDNRSDYTKSDWCIWTATLADNIDDFQSLADPVYKFALETEDRVPLTDWHYTSRGKMEGFQARSVVGGFFIKVLKEEWKKEKFYKILEREVF
ncbi:glutaminase domain-containing protein [Aquiflexum sp.]|uniref:glutaminase domain-containing protein n=1 Tax=Aquiflexum sp. TaxID=1872584 RepID=UPI00359331CF